MTEFCNAYCKPEQGIHGALQESKPIPEHYANDSLCDLLEYRPAEYPEGAWLIIYKTRHRSFLHGCSFRENRWWFEWVRTGEAGISAPSTS